MKHWLVKQEPGDYSWHDFVKDQGTAWTGVRNFQARKNLKSMRTGDRVFFYHSGTGQKEVVGVAQVKREAYPDKTAEEGDWVCVDLNPVKPLAEPVSLESIKCDPVLKDIALLRQSRLSVMPLSAAEFDRILDLGKTSL